MDRSRIGDSGFELHLQVDDRAGYFKDNYQVFQECPPKIASPEKLSELHEYVSAHPESESYFGLTCHLYYRGFLILSNTQKLKPSIYENLDGLGINDFLTRDIHKDSNNSVKFYFPSKFKLDALEEINRMIWSQL